MKHKLSFAVFASEKGHGDAERASILSHAGTVLARKGARLIFPVGSEGVSAAMVKSARAAGGEVVLLAGDDFAVPSALASVPIEGIGTVAERYRRLNNLCDAYLGLPGSLGSVSALYQAWLASDGRMPVGLLNRNKAFEVVRGFAVDVLHNGKPDWEKSLVISETIEDLWNRLTRMVNAA